MSMTELCNNNKLLPVRFSVYSYVNSGQHPLYGYIDTTIREIEMSDKQLTLKDEKGREAGYLKFNQFFMDMRPSLVEYLKQGWNVAVSVGIDFTLSNLEI